LKIDSTTNAQSVLIPSKFREGIVTYRQGGPEGTVRPFTPGIGVIQTEFQAVEALDHIARALSAIDHNIEIMAAQSKAQTEILVRLVRAVEDKT
jgi:hypothetical protein